MDAQKEKTEEKSNKDETIQVYLRIRPTVSKVNHLSNDILNLI